ncbi:MAG TPA: MaoC/PaaZ C-terminal domain-containing protein [Solirubrobacteraceae bacterium]|nr:MaoC/PaaZ C-terminal domain-containing protein [Solirubrobacteraceae bacterium]
MTQLDFSEPFEALCPGARFVSRARTITESDVVAFASLTGDWHPQHADAEWAATSAFGERIAHGLLVVSCAAGLVRFDPERVVALRGLGDTVFKRPVRLGATIHVEGEVSGLRPAGDDAGLVTLAWRVRNQHGQLVCRARVDVVWRRDRPAPAAVEPEHGFVAIPL